MLAAYLLAALALISTASAAGLPDHATVRAALKTIVAGQNNGGFGLHMWATVVDRDGKVVLVCHSGENRGDQWPGSRVISAQKANTANAFSLTNLALSTAQLFTAVQPGGSLFGLQHSNPVNPMCAYRGKSAQIGTTNDPMVGCKIGGVNVFGGGLALYNKDKVLLGAIGVSGDSSCADHNIGWKLRKALDLNHIPGGVSPEKDDNIVNDIIDHESLSGWGHPNCADAAASVAANFTGRNWTDVKASFEKTRADRLLAAAGDDGHHDDHDDHHDDGHSDGGDHHDDHHDDDHHGDDHGRNLDGHEDRHDDGHQDAGHPDDHHDGGHVHSDDPHDDSD